jgi:cbb3-type cytochrome oxidase cytochrome c subunit
MADQQIYDGQNRRIGILEDTHADVKRVYDANYNRIGYFSVANNTTYDRHDQRIGTGDQRMRLIG